MKDYNKMELPEGWFSCEDITTYRELVSNIPNNGSLLELGSWKGRSICSVAQLLIEKNIKVYIVDTFQGTESEGDAHKEAKQIDLRSVFVNNIKLFGIDDRITIIQGRTDDVVKEFKDKSFDLVFIDADHQEESVFRDINNYKNKVNDNGIISGHDWQWASVRRAVSRSGLGIINFGNMWYHGKLRRNNKFSICFIGRNEERVLPKAFNSIKKFKERGGEVCFLDTGSSDNTAQIAKDFGCIVQEVGDKFVSIITKEEADAINKHFIVEGESPIMKEGDRLFRFGDARNYCANNLATNDMVAWMDCDEVYTKFDIDKLEELISSGVDQFEYNFVFAHDRWGHEAVKFIQSKFHNKKKIQWNGIIHEVLSGPGNRKFVGEDIVKLEHWQNEETKRDGYLRGLALDCWQHPNSDRNSHYLARELYWTGRYKSAIKEFERHLTIGRWAPERSQSCLYVGECYMRMGEIGKGIEWMHRSYQEDGGRREPLIRLAETYYYQHNWLKVASYCMAALEIPFSGYYATNKSFYTNVPHELLAEAKWHLGDRAASKVHFDKALEYVPLSSKLLHDYRFHYGIPKVSILIPTLGRPEGLKRCLDSIEKLNFPKECLEVLVVEDSPRIGVPKRMEELLKKSVGEYLVFASNDVEFTPDSLILAFIDMNREKKRLCAFNTGSVYPDEGNICEHFIIRRDLIDKIGGKIFDTDFDHCGVDNLLWYKCRKLNEAMRSDRAVLIHHHFSKDPNVKIDDTYKLVNLNRQKDAKLLKNKICDIELEEFSDNIRNNVNFSFTKVGDGEMMCIRGDNGANCDGQSYSKKLGESLLWAYRSMSQNKDVILAVQSDPRYRLIDVENRVFSGLTPCFNYWTYDILLNRVGEMSDRRLYFYKTIKYSDRKKIFVGNSKLSGVAKMLDIDKFVEVPSKDAFNNIDSILNKLNDLLRDDCIIMFSAGLISKVLMAKVLDMNHNITCIDTGSAFDPIFIGQTRTNQISMQELRDFYKSLLV